MLRVVLIFVSFVLIQAPFAQKVSNVSVEMIKDQVIVTYDLDKDADYVYLKISDNHGETYREVQATGDIGEDIKAGKLKKIIYKAGDTFFCEDCIFRVGVGFISLQKKADAYFEKKDYGAALEVYKEILLADNTNSYATERINRIKEINTFLETRRNTIFSYKKCNPDDYTQFRSDLMNDINTQILNNEDGFLSFTYTISFDTSGQNRSSSGTIRTSLPAYTFNTKTSLNPCVDRDYFCAASEKIPIDLKWSTESAIFRYTSKGISPVSSNQEVAYAMEKYIYGKTSKYGKYVVDIKNIESNQKSFADIRLKDYKVAGPGAFIYSALLPGTGTLKVTYGKKGWGRLAAFLTSTAIALGTRAYSNNQYKNYLSTTDQKEMDKFYNNANLTNKIALSAGAISALIYIHDIVWVISKGSKNIREATSLQNELKKGPIYIRKSTIDLP